MTYLRTSKTSRSVAMACIAAMLVQTLAPAIETALRSRSWYRYAEGVEWLDDRALDDIWGADANDVSGGGEGMAGFGINMGTGHMTMGAADVSIPLIEGLSLTVARTQSSHQFSTANDDGDTMLGVSWWCNWDTHYLVDGDDIIWMMPNGNQRIFTDKWIHPGTGHPRWKSVTGEGTSAKFERTQVGVWLEEVQISPTIHVLTTENNEKWTFHDGALYSYTDDAGNIMTLERDAGNDNRITKIKAPSGDGRFLELAYKTSTNLLETVTLKLDRNNDTDFIDAGDENELLVTYNYGNGSSPYVPSDQLRSVQFPNGMKLIYTYGSYELSAGPTWTHVTDASDNTEPMRTLAQEETYYHDGSSWVTKAQRRYDWHEHSEGHLGTPPNTASEAWIEKQYAYDWENSDWELTSEYDWNIVGNGNTVPYHAQGGEIEFEGNSSYDDLYTADSNGDILEIGYWFDANPITAPTYEVTRAGHRSVATQKLPPGMTGQDATYAYNTSDTGSDGEYHYAYGTLKDHVDFLGRRTTWTVLAQYNVRPQNVDIAGKMTSHVFNGDRRVTSTTDIDSLVSTAAYNADGTMSQSKDKLGRYTTHTYYATRGNYGYRLTSESPVGTVTTSEYDAWGATTKTISSTGIVTTYDYTDSNVPRRVLQYVTDNLGNRTTYEYDTRGLKTGMVDPDGSRTTWVYNEGGRLKNVINPLDYSTEYVYDVHGRMIAFIDQRGLETQYQYDASGRKTAVIEEDSTTTTYAYDGGGCGCSGSGPPNKPTAMKTRANDHFAYSYDVAGRMTSLAYPGGSRTVTFAYTVDGDNPYGALRKVRDPNFASGWDNNYHFEYKYDASGRQLEERFPDGEKTVMAYDGSKRLQNLKFNTSSFITTYTYDTYSRPSVTSNSLGQSVTYNYYTSAGKKGMVEQLTYSGGLISTYDYDALLRLQKFKHDPTSGSNIEKYYTYNADSTIDSIYDGYSVTPGSFTGLRWNYDYDGANQMTRESRQDMLSGAVDSTVFEQEYTFDEAGNRLTRTGSGTGYEEFDATIGAGYNDLNQLMEYSIDGNRPIEHTYDNAGRLTDKSDGDTIEWSYRWGKDGTLVEVGDAYNGTDIRYVYDWKGRRLEREDETSSSNGPKRRYYFVGLTPVAERTATWSGLGGGTYTWGDDVYNTLTGGSIGQVLWRRTGGSTDNSLHYDHIGNVLAEANTSGVVTVANEQDAYGRPILSSAAGWSDNSLHQTAKPWDDGSELFYFNARWYDGQLGQFESPAPMERSLEHQYNISINNPNEYADVTGRRIIRCGFFSGIGKILRCLFFWQERYDESTDDHCFGGGDGTGGGALGQCATARIPSCSDNPLDADQFKCYEAAKAVQDAITEAGSDWESDANVRSAVENLPMDCPSGPCRVQLFNATD